MKKTTWTQLAILVEDILGEMSQEEIEDFAYMLESEGYYNLTNYSTKFHELAKEINLDGVNVHDMIYFGDLIMESVRDKVGGW